MSDKPSSGQSGGVSVTGGSVQTGGGDLFGGDKVINASPARLDDIFESLRNTIASAPAHDQPEAKKKLEALEQEAAKGKNADDKAMAKLVEGLVGLVPTAISGVVGAFATPVLGAIAGPITKYALEKIQGK